MAHIVIVGEQPGDQEDREGTPFVGPAGQLLRRLLESAGVDPADIYLTNAVKHFKWEPRGKRRIHKTPAQREIDACHAWLDAELAAIKPAVVVALGRTALHALTGASFSIAEARGNPIRLSDGTPVVATYHPSAALRAIDPTRRDELERALRADLERALRLAGPGRK